MQGDLEALSAIVSIARMTGHFKAASENEGRQGALVAPAPMTPEEWAKAAFEQQREARKPKQR